MPWRKPYDPALDDEGQAQRAYEVWISEIMLQQTQVATVIPYYTRWMERYPTIRDLAASDIETVNGLWKGLGYYSRAARLLKGAQLAVSELGGRLPDNAREMEATIPGIGRYSAGAICSIAYNECVPVLDGNVHRLLSRVLALHAPPKAKQTLDLLWKGATVIVENSTRPGDVNQALIEVGSTVCKVRDPQCGSCPLQAWCEAHRLQEGAARREEREDAASDAVPVLTVPDIEELCTVCEPLPAGAQVTCYPMKAEKKKVREEVDIVNVIEWRRGTDGGRFFLLARRPEGGLLAGLHEFPTAPCVPVTTSSAAQIEIAHTVLSDFLASAPKPYARTSGHQRDGEHSDAELAPALRIVKIAPAGDVAHVFSHIRKTYRVQWVLLEGGGHDPPAVASARRGASAAARTRRRTATAADAAAAPRAPAQAAWTPLADVAHANIGTGVLKVWTRVRALWDEDG
ncbi:DNA glycosylase [Wolfiporia cocos MD-104 SS10]|uniref:Adenine DNA glycosylase n=1 Tax=Wolfiporia cocos (strain MD-104) TaxID=742152 RepID=A0A2H3K8V2_WOLCO|nr:DNA glycosylase [Wolfiporia cocos MD-104 SS10]